MEMDNSQDFFGDFIQEVVPDERSFEELLIEAAQAHECLFDKRCGAYRKRADKEKAWLDVAAAAGRNVEQCQLRWRSLRDRFVRENKKQPASGSAAVEDGSEWIHFNQLCFLKQCLEPRRTISNTLWTYPEPSGIATPPAPEFEATSPITFEEAADDLRSPTPRGGSSKRKKDDDERKERFDSVMGLVSNFLEDEKKVSPEKSRNADYYKTLDSYLLQLPYRTQDSLKIEFLNKVFSEVNKILTKRFELLCGL